MEIILNGSDIAEFLGGLNTCFPGWGDQHTFAWAFQRAIAPDPLPDRITLCENGVLLAGSAVTYRSLHLRNGNFVRVGIMTGSWTLPPARGRGCFSRIIAESLAITHARGGALLLAFVTEDNPSCRQLQRAGAAMVPTSYLSSVLPPPVPGREILLVEIDPSTAAARCNALTRSPSSNSFRYQETAGWLSQWIHRPGQVTALASADALACVESSAETDRLLGWHAIGPHATGSLLAAVGKRARLRGKRLFTFCTGGEDIDACIRIGLTSKPGYLTAMIADAALLGRALQNGSHPTPNSSPPLHSELADPQSSWYLGPWHLQSGDRM